MINLNSTNEELLQDAKIKEVLNSANIVVIDKKETANPEFITLCLGQTVNLGGGSINPAAAMLLGFSGQIQRCFQNVSAENAEAVNIGDNLNEIFDTDFALQINDSLTPNPDFNHKPRQGRNRETKELEMLVCKETASPVYRQCELVLAEDIDHTVIKTVLESQYEGGVIKKNKVLSAQS